MAYTTIPAAASSGGATLTTLTGLTEKQIVFGAADGTGTSSADLIYDDTTNDLTVSASESGGTVGITLANSSNTASSAAQHLIQVAGASGGDPSLRLSVSGVTTWDLVVNNGTSDRLELRSGATTIATALTGGEMGIAVAPEAFYTLKIGAMGANNYNFGLLDSASNTSQAAWYVRASVVTVGLTSYGGSAGGSTSYGETKAALSGVEIANATRFVFAFNTTAKALVDSTSGLGAIPSANNRAWVGGTIKTLQTDVGNVGTGEDTLHTYTLPALMLGTDGQSIEIEVVVTCAANANNKQVKLHFGATVIADSGIIAQNGGSMVLRARVTRTAAATQRALGTVSASTYVAPSYTTPAETLSGTIVIKVTGEATSNDDLVSKITSIKWAAAL